MSEEMKKGRLSKAWAWVLLPLLTIAVIWAFFIYAPALLWDERNQPQNADVLQTLITILASFAGLYALWVATIRVNRFSKQVETQIKQADTAQEQLFNERLGRGVTLLKDDSVTMRRAGIRVLWDLGKTSSLEEAKLIVEIIYDFVCQKATIQKDSAITARQDRLDIELGIYALAGLIKKAKMTTKDIPFANLDLCNLHFKDLELQQANFSGAKLHETGFFQGKLHKANFSHAKLHGATFRDAKLNGANFSRAELNDAHFFSVQFKKIDFSMTDFSNFSFLNEIPLDKKLIDSVIFEESRPPIILSDDEKDWAISAPKNRAYTWEIDENGERRKKFIAPENKEDHKRWSGRWV